MAKLSKIIYISLFTAICLYCFFTNNKLGAINVHENNKNTLEFVKSPDLKTVKLHRMGWELSEPTLELFSSDKLLFTFDDLSENPGVYGYTLTHYDSDWNPTPIFYSDYMDGFKVNEIRDYSLSMGSIISYVHFRLEIPNQDVKLKISGNYILRVFDVYKPDDILIQRKFIIYEPLVAVEASIRQPSAGEQRYSGQQMELKVNTSTLRVTDPNTEIKTIVCQNYLFQGC